MTTFVNSCFCGLVTLKNGTKGILYLYWAWSMGFLISDSNYTIKPFPNRAWISSSGLISSSIGLYGARSENPLFIVPEVLVEAVHFILYLANLITFVITTKFLMPNIEMKAWIYAVPGFNDKHATYGTFFVVVTIINLVFRLYFFLVVISYCQKLWCRETQERGSTVATVATSIRPNP